MLFTGVLWETGDYKTVLLFEDFNFYVLDLQVIPMHSFFVFLTSGMLM